MNNRAFTFKTVDLNMLATLVVPGQAKERELSLVREVPSGPLAVHWMP